LNGNGLRLDTEFGPTYSYIQPSLAIIHLFFMHWVKDFIFAERVFLLLFSSITIVLYYFLCTRFFSKGLALLSTLILIFYPPQWFWMTRLNPHSFATNMMVICFLLFYMGWERKSYLLAFIVGICWGLLTQFRPEYEMGLLFLVFASFIFFKVWKERIVFSSLLISGWIVLMAPWVIRNYKIHGIPVVSTTHYGINLWMVFNPTYTYTSTVMTYPPELLEQLKNESNEVKRARIFVTAAKKNIKADPKMAMERVVFPKAASIKENIVYVSSYLPVFIFFLIGLFRMPWKDPKWIAVYAFMGYKVLAHVPFYMIVRFREATFPMMLLIAMIPLQGLWSRAESNN
jgi:4-amino-4-deoxy-L-arabinose transferase-like glycosyltransferase